MGNNRKYSHSPPFLKGTSFSKELKGRGVRNIPSWRGQLQRPSGHRPPGSVLTTCASATQWQLAFATLRWAGGSFIRSSCSSRIRCSSGNWLKLTILACFCVFWPPQKIPWVVVVFRVPGQGWAILSLHPFKANGRAVGCARHSMLQCGDHGLGKSLGCSSTERNETLGLMAYPLVN